MNDPTLHVTARDITALVEAARAAHVSRQAFAEDMRRVLALPPEQPITKRFLQSQLTIAMHEAAMEAYRTGRRPGRDAEEADAASAVTPAPRGFTGFVCTHRGCIPF